LQRQERARLQKVERRKKKLLAVAA